MRMFRAFMFLAAADLGIDDGHHTSRGGSGP
jgi:hypothetical protein